MSDPWHSLASSFAYGHQMSLASTGRVGLDELRRRLSPTVQRAIDALDLWGAQAALVDLHGVRSKGAKSALTQLGDAPLWVVSTGKGKGVLRDVLVEVVEASPTHRIVYWAGATPARPVPSLAVVATHELADAVSNAAELKTGGGRTTLWFIAVALGLALWGFCS
jgi:hypothetical protein